MKDKGEYVLGHKYWPFFEDVIDFCYIIPDELHLYLRITDILLDAVMDEMDDPTFQRLMNAFEIIGVRFRVYFDKTDKTKVTGMTTLSKAQRRVMLLNARVFLSACLGELHPLLENKIKLFHEFEAIHQEMTKSVHIDPKLFKKRAAKWTQLVRSSYVNRDITPYMHALSHHVPVAIASLQPLGYPNLALFSCQSTEKKNHCQTATLYQATFGGGEMQRADGKLEAENEAKTIIERELLVFVFGSPNAQKILKCDILCTVQRYYNRPCRRA